MSWLGDVFKFENFNLNNQWGKLKKNPERAFIGAMDEGGTKVWNKAFDWTAPVTGIHRHYEPMTDYWGGASKDSYTKANAAGINTGPARSMHNVAKTIASAYAGGYGASQLGAGAGAGGAIDSTAVAGGGSGGGGAFVPSAGSGANFGIDAGGSYGLSGGAGADVYGGWSPSGSSPSGSPSTLSPSSSNPAAYNDPYAAQDVMQQGRDTSVASGEAGAWDNPSAPSSGGSGLSSFQKQLMAKSLMNMGGKGGYQKPEDLKIIKAQNPFAQMGEQLPIQDKKDEASILAEILRNYNG
jgi:hypothetical protein